MKYMLKNKIKNLLDIYKSRGYDGEIKYEKYLDVLSLSTEEIELIKSKWHSITPRIKDGYRAFKIYKTIHGFNVNYIPACYYFPFITSVLNNPKYIASLSHKGMMPISFDGITQPHIIVNSINGIILDDNQKVVHPKHVIDILKQQSGKMIIKPSTETSSGKGVKVIYPDVESKELETILNQYKKDFVIQKFVDQSDFTKRYNPTSLQTIRVNTLLLNGKLTVECVVMRIGGLNSVVDNMGAGGFMVGVNKDGSLKNVGYSLDGKMYYQSNNTQLNGAYIPNYDNIKILALKAHMRIPCCSLVGWDIALDKNNNPVLIEANLSNPSCFGVQLCGNPFFGDRTDEVIDYVRNNNSDFKLFL